MRTSRVVAVLALFLLSPSLNGATGDPPAQAPAPATQPAPVKAEPPEVLRTPEGVLSELYRRVTFPPGKEADWDAVRALFLPQAVVVLRTSREATTVFDLAGFVADFVAFAAKPKVKEWGFAERIVRMKVTPFREVAQAWVLYEASLPGSPRPPQQGVDGFSLVRRDGRWFIASIVNDLVEEGYTAPRELREAAEPSPTAR